MDPTTRLFVEHWDESVPRLECEEHIIVGTIAVKIGCDVATQFRKNYAPVHFFAKVICLNILQGVNIVRLLSANILTALPHHIQL
jgi:hypothetical protein